MRSLKNVHMFEGCDSREQALMIQLTLNLYSWCRTADRCCCEVVRKAPIWATEDAVLAVLHKQLQSIVSRMAFLYVLLANSLVHTINQSSWNIAKVVQQLHVHDLWPCSIGTYSTSTFGCKLSRSFHHLIPGTLTCGPSMHSLRCRTHERFSWRKVCRSM